MSKEIVLEDGKVCHGSINQGRERRIATVLGDDDIAPPCMFVLKARSLNVANCSVNREWHSIASHDGVEDDIRLCKLSNHAVECFYELGENGESNLLSFSDNSLPDISKSELRCLRRSGIAQVSTTASRRRNCI
jgi:hypothetical protein